MSWAIEHKGMARTIAHIVHRRAVSAGVHLDASDLYQDAAEIAIKAEALFDPARGVKASTYLYQALLRGLNEVVDYAIYRKHNEQDGLDIPERGCEFGDDLKLWDFLRTLSDPAQVVFMNWLTPSANLHTEIKARTIGRRCSMKALFHYLHEKGHDGDQLKTLQCEIFNKVRLYEG